MKSESFIAPDDGPKFSADESCARQLDAADSLAAYRDQFHVPKRDNGTDVVYFAGNSLGLMPRRAKAAMEQELDDWAEHAVDAHFSARTPWYSYQEQLREPTARLVGGKPSEVVLMNSVTVNLHLMMVTFYRPTKSRYKVLMEDTAFPSDTYAVKTQLRHHGVDPTDALLIAKPCDGERTLRTEDIEALLDKHGDQIAVVLMGGINYFTGQVFDMARITTAAKKHGCRVGFDLAHAAGNVELSLHDWSVDFAVWCNYKYLNAGPGAVAGCFVHEQHAGDINLQRFGGWWGNDPNTRFRMHLQPDFVPVPSADGWQISNPPIFSLAPVRVSYEMFDEVGMAALRRKSTRLMAYLRFLVDPLAEDRFEVITPHSPDACGCQLSMLVCDRPEDLLAALKTEGVVCDFREPNVIRVAPTPLYNTFQDVWRFSRALLCHANRS